MKQQTKDATPSPSYALYSKSQLKYERSKGLQMTDEENENFYRPDSEPSPSIPVKEGQNDNLQKLADLLESRGVRKYLNINNSGYSQIERDIVELLSPSPLPVKEGEVLDITKGEWELDDTSINGITLWADDKRDEGICLATIYTEAKEYETIAALIVSAPAMYRALKNIRNWYEQNAHRIAPDTPICFSEALSILQKATPNK